MSFADPQSVTISAIAHSLPRVTNNGSVSVYSKDDNTVVLSASHSRTNGNRFRRVIKINHKKVVPDPLFPAQNVPYEMSSYLVVNAPITGYTIAEQKAVIDGFIVALNAASGLLLTKLLGGES